jgi:putative acetyltransferase
MRGELAIRNYRWNDLDDVIDVFNRAIRETAYKDYTPAQLDAWAQPDRQIWAERRLSRPTWVAEVDGQVVGFTDLESDGHVDMMYVHPCAAGKGFARALLEKAEEHALLTGISSRARR